MKESYVRVQFETYVAECQAVMAVEQEAERTERRSMLTKAHQMWEAMLVEVAETLPMALRPFVRLPEYALEAAEEMLEPGSNSFVVVEIDGKPVLYINRYNRSYQRYRVRDHPLRESYTRFDTIEEAVVAAVAAAQGAAWNEEGQRDAGGPADSDPADEVTGIQFVDDAERLQEWLDDLNVVDVETNVQMIQAQALLMLVQEIRRIAVAVEEMEARG